MKKFGKTLIVGAALVMSMSLITGCGDDKKETGKITETSTEEAGKATPNDASDNMSFDEYVNKYGKDVKLGNYKGIEYENSPVQVTDEDVKKKVQEFVDSCVTYNEDKESVTKDGDTVNIDFVGTVDGVPFEGGDTNGAGCDLVLGSGSFIDNFEEQVEGHKAGDKFDVKVTFPENYGKDELNGKEAVFATTVNYIKVPVEAEYNDELVSKNTDYSNTADYEKSIREALQTSNDAAALSSAQNLIMVNAINSATIDNLSEDEVNSMADEIKTSIQEQAAAYNIDYATYISYYYGYSDETEFDKYVKSVCEETLKEKMVVCAIAMAENITIDDKEEAEFVKKMASDNHTSEDEVKSYYAENDIKYYTLADKVMQFMMDNGVNKAETNQNSTAATEAATEAE